MTPRDYQLAYRQAIRKGWADGFRRQLVVSPTGSGKTVMFSWEAEAAMNSGERTLILVDQDELVWQTMEKLATASSIVGEVEKAEFSAPKDCPVVVATVQSMAQRLDNWPADHFGLVIADEADKSIAPQFQSVLQHFSPARVLGFTATPHRTDQRNLGEYYENAIELENLVSLIEKGFLSPITVKMLPIQIDLSAVRVKDGDYDKDELDEIITPHLRNIAESILAFAAFRKTLVFLPLVRTCEKFVEIARDIGVNADFVHGKDPERDSKLARFKRFEFDVLANSQLLTRGYDDPSIDCIVPCRFTKSITLYSQITGRGTRIALGKLDMLLLDFLFQASKKLVCRPAHLIAKSDVEAEVITELIEKAAAMPGDVAADLIEVNSSASSQREEALRKKLEEQRNKKAKTISAEEFCLNYGEFAACDYEPAMAWERAPVTDKQKPFLKRAKIDLESVKCAGHASQLLDIYFREVKKPKLASASQVALMKRLRHVAVAAGITDFDNVTTAQVGAFFTELNKQKRQPQMV